VNFVFIFSVHFFSFNAQAAFPVLDYLAVKTNAPAFEH